MKKNCLVPMLNQVFLIYLVVTEDDSVCPLFDISLQIEKGRILFGEQQKPQRSQKREDLWSFSFAANKFVRCRQCLVMSSKITFKKNFHKKNCRKMVLSFLGKLSNLVSCSLEDVAFRLMVRLWVGWKTVATQRKATDRTMAKGVVVCGVV